MVFCNIILSAFDNMGRYAFVSSAKIFIKIDIREGRSLIKYIKRVGPRTLP